MGTWTIQANTVLPMFEPVRKNRALDQKPPGEIPARGNVEANTPEWRARVIRELGERPRGEQAKIVDFVQRWYPRFSTGTMSGLLMDDEKPGQHRHSRYIPLINRYLWPNENPIDESLEKILRAMDLDEQRKLAEFLMLRKK